MWVPYNAKGFGKTSPHFRRYLKQQPKRAALPLAGRAGGWAAGGAGAHLPGPGRRARSFGQGRGARRAGGQARLQTAPSNVKNLDKNQEAVNDPNKRVTPVNPNPLQPSEKTSQIINLSEDLVKFVSESNIDDVMVITVANPHLKNSVTSHPTEIRKTTPENFKNSPNAKFDGGVVEKKKLEFVIDLTREGLSTCNTENPAPVLMPPSKADLSPKAITPVAENGVEESGSFDHLPPLPEPPPILRELTDNVLDTLPPQKPELRVKQILRPWGIALTWNIPKINPRCAPVESYHLFLCYESSKDKLTWKKIGEIKALPLPMACTLSQFLTASKYYFTIQSKDIFGRYGPFCDIKCIPGFSENLT
uniref:activating transcription factor 7-interacting protein 2 n=1 Tax=Jaculus jaculus TaxID=51337 RepID=UPI001E1AFD28|nr:activating transcription factor 7-interacting protein 2 [Jaculus jaculus]